MNVTWPQIITAELDEKVMQFRKKGSSRLLCEGQKEIIGTLWSQKQNHYLKSVRLFNGITLHPNINLLRPIRMKEASVYLNF